MPAHDYVTPGLNPTPLYQIYRNLHEKPESEFLAEGKKVAQDQVGKGGEKTEEESNPVTIYNIFEKLNHEAYKIKNKFDVSESDDESLASETPSVQNVNVSRKTKDRQSFALKPEPQEQHSQAPIEQPQQQQQQQQQLKQQQSSKWLKDIPQKKVKVEKKKIEDSEFFKFY